MAIGTEIFRLGKSEFVEAEDPVLLALAASSLAIPIVLILAGAALGPLAFLIWSFGGALSTLWGCLSCLAILEDRDSWVTLFTSVVGLALSLLTTAGGIALWIALRIAYSA